MADHASPKKFNFSLDELAENQETAAEEELRKEISTTAGGILALVREIAEMGDLARLKAIEEGIKRVVANDDNPRRPTRRSTAPAAPTPVIVPEPTEPPPPAPESNTSRLKRLTDRVLGPTN